MWNKCQKGFRKFCQGYDYKLRTSFINVLCKTLSDKSEGKNTKCMTWHSIKKKMDQKSARLVNNKKCDPWENK